MLVLMLLGIRLDSGDLAALSKASRLLFIESDQKLATTFCSKLNIVASDDIDEEKLKSVQASGHEINTFGIGTHLVTCKKQPALGCVYKLVKINGSPRIKLSENEMKITLPHSKMIYRLYDDSGIPILDIAMVGTEPMPQTHSVMRYYQIKDGENSYSLGTITPSGVEPLLHKVWDAANGIQGRQVPRLLDSKAYCERRVSKFFQGKRLDLDDPHYPLALSEQLFSLTNSLKAEVTSKKREFSSI